MPPTRSDSDLRLALAQMALVPGDRDGNLARALGFIAQAADEGADVVLLPEALPLGWMAAGTRALAEPAGDGPTWRALRDAARTHRVHVCSGVVERDGARVYNAAVLVGPTGDVLLQHRKINELDIASDVYDRGDRLGVAHTPLGTFGLMICADAFADGLVVTHTLGLMGAEVILSPCAWAVPPTHDNVSTPYGSLWRDSYGPVARAHDLWIAGASSVGPIVTGPWSGHACIGASLVVGPSGPVLQGPFGPDAEALLHCRLTRRPGRRSEPHAAPE